MVFGIRLPQTQQLLFYVYKDIYTILFPSALYDNLSRMKLIDLASTDARQSFSPRLMHSHTPTPMCVGTSH
jgi:hypothetical protein